MRALLQRVRDAQVEADGEVVGRIGNGLLVYLGIGISDGPGEAERLAEKLAGLRIFTDDQGKLNRSVQEAEGGILAISNFTLMADSRKGRRPSFTAAAPAEQAEPLYEAFVAKLRQLGCPVACGRFGAKMLIRSQADGPVNLIVEWPAPAGPSP